MLSYRMPYRIALIANSVTLCSTSFKYGLCHSGKTDRVIESLNGDHGWEQVIDMLWCELGPH